MLAHTYAEPPFRVGPTIDVDGAAYLILVCAGPGVFGGDALHQSIHVGRGARVMLTSQSALQIHPSADTSTALLRQEYRVDEDAELEADWDPAIPFADARLDQRIAVELAAGARLLWSDAVMSGRAGRGETWQYASFAHELHLRARGALAYLERYALTPDRRPARPWIAGDANYAGTAIVAHESATPTAAAELHGALQPEYAGEAAADCVRNGLVVARFLSSSGSRFAAARDMARNLALHSIFGRAAASKRK